MKTIHSLWAKHKRTKFPDMGEDEALVQFAKKEFYDGMRGLMEMAVDNHVQGINPIEFYNRCGNDMADYVAKLTVDNKPKIILPGG